jgi:hypothetical protein
MILPEEDAKQFYKLYNSLLFKLNEKFEIFKDLKSPSDLLSSDLNDLMKLKEKLYASPELIDSFVKENPMNLSPDELEIVSSWKDFVKARFYVVRHLKDYTVFLDPQATPKAYGVIGIAFPLEEILGSYLPRMVEATLLPFRDKIVYDGTIMPFNLFFGSGIRRSINDSYMQAKASFGIITSLLPSSKMVSASDSDILRGYLKTEYSRDVHRQEIHDLLIMNPDLKAVYYGEMGKVHARAYRKKLKALGAKRGWFCMIGDIVIAAGRTREEAERIAESLLPADKMRLVYIFHLKAK